jgi:hypothetical protein
MGDQLYDLGSHGREQEKEIKRAGNKFCPWMV